MAEPKTMKELLHAYRTKRPSKAKVALAKRKIIHAIEKKGIKKCQWTEWDVWLDAVKCLIRSTVRALALCSFSHYIQSLQKSCSQEYLFTVRGPRF